MAHKTRRHRSRKSDANGIFTIPEVRRSFEHIESVLHSMIHENKTMDAMISSIKKEWMTTFRKNLSKSAAKDLIEDCMKHTVGSKRKTRRNAQRGGSVNALTGAPLGHDMRQGEYMYYTPGGMGDYFMKGLSVGIPTIADAGKAAWPHPGPEMGSNLIKGGSRKIRRSGGGNIVGAIYDQAFMRPVSASSPSNALFDAETIWSGRLPGESSDPSQQTVPYQTLPGSTKPFSI